MKRKQNVWDQLDGDRPCGLPVLVCSVKEATLHVATYGPAIESIGLPDTCSLFISSNDLDPGTSVHVLILLTDYISIDHRVSSDSRSPDRGFSLRGNISTDQSDHAKTFTISNLVHGNLLK